MRVWAFTAASAALLWPTSAAFADAPEIILSRVEGKVFVDGGDGPQLSLVGKQLSHGTKIFVGADSEADVHFAASDCTFKILPLSMVTVPAASPCPAGEAWMTATPVIAQPTADLPVDPSAGEVAAEPNGLGTALVMGGVAAAAIGAVILLTKDDDDNGSSFPVSRP